jgi:hypothetical protein
VSFLGSVRHSWWTEKTQMPYPTQSLGVYVAIVIGFLSSNGGEAKVTGVLGRCC